MSKLKMTIKRSVAISLSLILILMIGLSAIPLQVFAEDGQYYDLEAEAAPLEPTEPPEQDDFPETDGTAYPDYDASGDEDHYDEEYECDANSGPFAAAVDSGIVEMPADDNHTSEPEAEDGKPAENGTDEPVEQPEANEPDYADDPSGPAGSEYSPVVEENGEQGDTDMIDEPEVDENYVQDPGYGDLDHGFVYEDEDYDGYAYNYDYDYDETDEPDFGSGPFAAAIASGIITLPVNNDTANSAAEPLADNLGCVHYDFLAGLERLSSLLLTFLSSGSPHDPAALFALNFATFVLQNRDSVDFDIVLDAYHRLYNAIGLFDPNWGPPACGGKDDPPTPPAEVTPDPPQDNGTEAPAAVLPDDGETRISDSLLNALHSGNPVILRPGDSTVITVSDLERIRNSDAGEVDIVLVCGRQITISNIGENPRNLDLNLAVRTLDAGTPINNVQFPASAMVITPATTPGPFGFTLSFTISEAELNEAGLQGNSFRLFHIRLDGSSTEHSRVGRNANRSVTISIDGASVYVLSTAAPLA